MRKICTGIMLVILVCSGGCFLSPVKAAKKTVNKIENMAIDTVRDMLLQGTKIAVAELSKAGGYSGDETLKIFIPEDLKGVTDKLRKIGFRAQINDFEVSMNLAAEQAAGQAGAVFINVIKHLKFKDVIKLLKGTKAEATRYLKKKAIQQLKAAYRPVIAESMEKVNAVKKLNKLLKKYNSIPFIQKVEFSIVDYVTDRSIEGLFVRISVAEVKIRKNPSSNFAKITKKIF